MAVTRGKASRSVLQGAGGRPPKVPEPDAPAPKPAASNPAAPALPAESMRSIAIDVPADSAPKGSRPALGPSPGPLTSSDLLAAAGRKAMWTHLDRLLAREPAAGDPERPDELRRYRVATRRLRAALRMFASAYPDREVRPVRRGLSQLAGSVGGVRDLDNRIADLNRWAIERDPGSRSAVSPLLVAWSKERKRAAAEFHARLDSRRHRRLLTALVAFVESAAPPGRKRATNPHTVVDRVASMIWAAYEDVRAYAPVVQGADVETLHDLRISTKRLRDDIDFLGPILGPRREWLTERLVALQDHLGTLNDADVAATAVRAFLEDRHARLAPDEQAEITAYLSDREGEIARLRGTSEQHWRPVAGIAFARRLARLVVVPAGTP